jgi:hypothetical protein
MRFCTLFLFFALAPPLWAQEKIALPPDVPTAAPQPPTPTVLTPNLIYMIGFTKPLIIRSAPDGIVSVTTDTGPLRVRGDFANGTGAVETRTFTQPFLYTVTPIATGTTELNVSLAGATDATTDIKRTIAAQTATPPAPPGPPAPPDPATAALQTALSADAGAWPAGSSTPATIAGALAKVYRSVGAGVNDPANAAFNALVSYGDLLKAVKVNEDQVVVATAIPALKAAIGTQFTAALGSVMTAPLNRPLAASTFNAVAQRLEGLR